MIYVVWGILPRCGSTMMMMALQAGGIPVAYDGTRDEMLHEFGDEDYKPNPGSFYEFNGAATRRDDWPYPELNGCCVKVITHKKDVLSPANKYRIVMMRRDAGESYLSALSFFHDQESSRRRDTVLNYKALFEGVYKKLSSDPNVASVNILDYRKVVEGDTVKEFKKLSDAGWPIDPVAASTIPDVSRIRYKREELGDVISSKLNSAKGIYRSPASNRSKRLKKSKLKNVSKIGIIISNRS